MELLLNKLEILDLGNSLRGSTIRCQEGTCWLTLEGDSRDHILHAGGSFAITQRGKLVLTANRDCRLQISATAKQQTAALWQVFCNN